MHQLHNRKALWIAAVLACLCGTVSLFAHVVPETPWHPVASAYLRSLFYLNLRPVPWDLVESEYASPLPEAGHEGRSVYDLLAPSAPNGDLSQIAEAIETQDPAALHRSATRAVSRLVRHHLERASEKLDDPGAARRELAAAEGINRAFVETGDPSAPDALGRAWLDLSSSVGTNGVLGIGGKPADRERFAAARAVVESTLVRSFEAEPVDPDPDIAPVPAHAPHARAVAERFARRLPPGANLNDQQPLPRLRLNFESRGIDEADLFLVAFGDMLFDSPMIFGEPAQSLGVACSTCHNRSDVNRDLFIPGMSHQPGAVDVDGELFNTRFNDLRPDPLDIPSLRGLRFTAPYGRDGRFASLHDFTRNVIVNEFGGPEPTPMMLDALVAYMFEFDWLPTPHLLPDGRLAPSAPEAARRGEEVFHRPFEGLGNRSCATCHVPSSNFMDGRAHDIGTGPRTEPGARDSFFDTPTLINAAHTAPYFHDGSRPTLLSVAEWFDGTFELGLSDGEVADLGAYLEVMGDAVDPYEHFDEKHTPFALAWEELSTFLTTLDTLLPARDRQHALLLLDTVAPDLRADVVGAWEPSAVAGRAYEIADILDELRDAVAADDWSAAETLYHRYEELADEHGPHLR